MRISEEIKKDFILLGLHIKKLREERNITIKEIAQKTGIRAQYLKKIEEGTAYRMYLDKHLLKIADVLEVKLSVIFSFNKALNENKNCHYKKASLREL